MPLPPSAKADVAEDLCCPAPSAGLSDQLPRNRRPTACYVDVWQSVTVMVDNGPSTHMRALTLRQLRAPSHRALGRRMSDGLLLTRATEIIKCCPTGSSIKS